MQVDVNSLKNELKKNESIKISIETSFEAAAKQRQTLCTILSQLFETTQDRVYQLGKQLSKMTSEHESILPISRCSQIGSHTGKGD